MEKHMKYIIITLLFSSSVTRHIQAMGEAANAIPQMTDITVNTNDGQTVIIPRGLIPYFETLVNMQINSNVFGHENDNGAISVPFSHHILDLLITDLRFINNAMDHDLQTEYQVIQSMEQRFHEQGNNPKNALLELHAAIFLGSSRLLNLYSKMMPFILLSDASLQMLRNNNTQYITLIKRIPEQIQERIEADIQNKIMTSTDPKEVLRIVQAEQYLSGIRILTLPLNIDLNGLSRVLLSDASLQLLNDNDTQYITLIQQIPEQIQERIQNEILNSTNPKDVLRFARVVDLLGRYLSFSFDLNRLPSILLSDASLRLLYDNDAEYITLINTLNPVIKKEIYNPNQTSAWIPIKNSPINSNYNNAGQKIEGDNWPHLLYTNGTVLRLKFINGQMSLLMPIENPDQVLFAHMIAWAKRNNISNSAWEHGWARSIFDTYGYNDRELIKAAFPAPALTPLTPVPHLINIEEDEDEDLDE